MVKFAGKYKQTKEEKYEDLLKELGVNFLLRKASKASTPIMEITEKSPGAYKIVTSTSLKSMEINFELGVPFDETTVDGRDCKTTVTQLDANTWVTKQVAKKSGQKDVELTRVFSDEGIDVTIKCDKVVSKQFYARE